VTQIDDALKEALADRYALERELGRGGMATVYLARDLKHDRPVALKVLHPELAALIGGERFLHEIKVTANLQHPHILPLHDSGENHGLLWYVMPYVAGESLRAKLQREKQLPILEAVTISGQIASALDYAHRHGVIHRDIKPENILLHDGQPSVADFGIALAVSQAGGSRLTETGLSIGTPQYMSPEQAMGDRELDARSDIYSLGVMLYEMLTGDPPYTGSTAQAIVAKVITEKPAPVTARRDTIPAYVAAAVHKAIAKLPADRFHAAAEFAEALVRPGAGETLADTVLVPSPGRLARPVARRRAAAIAGFVLLAGFAAWGWLRPGPRAPVVRFGLALPVGEEVQPVDVGWRIAIAPDGSRLVYVGPAEKGSQLWVKRRDQLHGSPLPGTDGGRNPFFSPDGRRLGFTTNNPIRLKATSFGGEPPITLADSGLSGGGAGWGSDGYIYVDTERGLQRLKASGGRLEPVVLLDSIRGEIGVAWPQVLPNGKAVLFRMRRADDALSDFEIIAVEPRSGRRTPLTRGVFARYSPSGHLLYLTADGKLLAAPFDQDKLALTGPPVAITDGIGIGYLGVADLAISASGTLVYGTGSPSAARVVVWVDRNGTIRALDPSWKPAGTLTSPALSPDGRSLAIAIPEAAGGKYEIWIKRGAGGPLSRLTFGDDSSSERPTWTPDGRSVLFVRTRAPGSGIGSVERKLADGTGPERLVVTLGQGVAEIQVSHDGRWLVLRTPATGSGGANILAMRMDADSTPTPLLATRFTEANPAFSPDDRWLAYMSDESGRPEVYVRPFPDVGSAKWQVSTQGGTEPIWGHSGRELFYRDGRANLVAAEIRTKPAFSVGKQVVLFSALPFAALQFHQQYDIAPDDQSFVMLGPTRSDAREDLVVVQNWFEELRAKVSGQGD
jgi:eukaryotic-like serine/threonine-protein kinase